MAMWSALEGITSTTSVTRGVLIIFSQNIRGRIGVFCNRYISGAMIEPTGEVGLEAVRTLLSIKGGMFGFRACIADEWSEVSQSLGLDIEELLTSRTSDEGADQALRNLMMPGSQLVRGSDAALLEGEEEAFAPTSSESEGSDSAAEEPLEAADDPLEPSLDSTGGDFSYLDWFADQMGQREQLPKFRQILMSALPKAGSTDSVDHHDAPAAETTESAPAEPESDLQLYGRLLQSEQDKVIRDIERSMERGRVDHGMVEETVSELQLLNEFIESEKERAQKWTGLDEIPTPKMSGGASQTGARVGPDALRTSQRMRAANFEVTGNTAQDVDNLLATSVSPATPKEFVKPNEKPPAGRIDPSRIDFTVHWWQRPPVISTLSVIAIGGLIYAINSHQANNAWEATLDDARRGLRQNPAAAAKLLTKAIQNHESSPRGYFYRGIAYGAAGDYDQSIHDLDTAVIKGEDKKLVELARAAAACRNSKYEEAISACDSVLKLDPNNSQAQSLKTLSVELKKAAEPLPVMVSHKPPEETQQPKEEEPEKPVKKAPLNTAVIADALHNDEPKLPKDQKQLVALGYQYLRSGDKSQAMSIFVEAVKRNPNDAMARRYLAHVLSEQGSAEAAVSQFNALVSLNALQASDAVPYALSLSEAGNEDRAKEVLAHFVKQAPNDINIRVELLRMYSNSGQKDKADALYQESLQYVQSDEARRMLQDAHGADNGETIHIRRR